MIRSFMKFIFFNMNFYHKHIFIYFVTNNNIKLKENFKFFLLSFVNIFTQNDNANQTQLLSTN